MSTAFTPYLARDRRFEDVRFDFWIADETGRSWYDSSPDQYMPERAWCRQHIRPGYTVVDCGAHHGMVSLLFGKWVGPNGRVVAYEALPENAAVIEKNAQLNGMDQITVRAVGVGAKNECLPVALNSGNTVVARGRSEKSIHIVALDNDLPPDVRVDFLKIDVEGFELQALRGARRILQQRPIVVLELHSFMFRRRKDQLARIMAELSSSAWRFEVLAGILDTSHRSFDGPVDLAWLSRFENPHVFCIPRERYVAAYTLFDWRSYALQSASRRFALAFGILPFSPDLSKPELERAELLRAAALGIFGAERFTLASKHKGGGAETVANYVARSELSSPKAKADTIIRAIYRNLFDRTPDPAGAAYWQEALKNRLDASENSGTRSEAIADIVLAIIAGASPPDREIMNARLERLA